MSPDLRNSRKRILIRPDGIDGLPSASGNAVVIAVAFVRTVGRVICPFQLRKINVLAWNVLNGRIVGFAKCQGVAGIGHYPACDRYYDASGIPLDGNRMIWIWKLDLLFFHVSVSYSARSLFYDRTFLGKEVFALLWIGKSLFVLLDDVKIRWCVGEGIETVYIVEP